MFNAFLSYPFLFISIMELLVLVIFLKPLLQLLRHCHRCPPSLRLPLRHCCQRCRWGVDNAATCAIALLESVRTKPWAALLHCATPLLPSLPLPPLLQAPSGGAPLLSRCCQCCQNLALMKAQPKSWGRCPSLQGRCPSLQPLPLPLPLQLLLPLPLPLPLLPLPLPLQLLPLPLLLPGSA
jgi:hypothetical protein